VEEEEEATMEMEPLSGCAGGSGGGGDESLLLGRVDLGFPAFPGLPRIFSAVIWIGAGHRTASPDTAAGAAPCPGRAIAAESKGPFPVESALLVPEWRRGGGSRRRGETKRWMASCADGSSVAERPWLGEARRRRYLAGAVSAAKRR